MQSSEGAIRNHFAANGSVFKPVEIVDYDGDNRWLWYMLKNPNSRKLRRKALAPNGTMVWVNPSYKDLRKEQQVQQAVLLDTLGWDRRIYLRGLRLRRDRRGDWRLVRDGGQS